jgi:hypothetical protein
MKNRAFKRILASFFPKMKQKGPDSASEKPLFEDIMRSWGSILRKKLRKEDRTHLLRFR